MTPSTFVGRKDELKQLENLRKRLNPSLVVIKGRRRVGKSRLFSFFASHHKKNKLWDFIGLAPTPNMTAQTQRDHFARRLTTLLKTPPFTIQDWTDAFEHLENHLKPGDIILLDEISWMALKDPTFIPKLKDWWDRQNSPIILALCGSVSTWIEDNILKSTAFFGRVNLTMTLEPLPIPDASKLLKISGYQGSHYDTFKLLCTLGGIPWYLEQITRGQSADDLINQLCFKKDGMLVLEFDRIFHDLFNGKGSSYKKILNSLKDGMKTLADIRQDINFPHSGTLSKLMEHLITAGFVQKQNLWSFKTAKPLKQSLYNICDPYLRFYLKMIEPQLNKINTGGFQSLPISKIPGFEVHMGLQFEQLLLQNRNLIINAIGIHPIDIIADGPYRQNKTSTKPGCQIDYLIQTATRNLFVCEFKFTRTELGIEMIGQVEKKIKALKILRGFAAIPVLFHISEISSELALDKYFYRIINVSEFLQN